MPSQRLLKILDPIGHTDRVLDSRAPKAVVWTTSRRRDAIARALRAAGITPLFAASPRHIASSLHPSARPYAAYAVIDLDLNTDVSLLATARWSGYRGTIIALSSSPLDDRTRLSSGIDLVISSEHALAAALAR